LGHTVATLGDVLSVVAEVNAIYVVEHALKTVTLVLYVLRDCSNLYLRIILECS